MRISITTIQPLTLYAGVPAGVARQLQSDPGHGDAPDVRAYFARIFGFTSFNITCLTATATTLTGRVTSAIVLDFSGSMNNETDIWNCEDRTWAKTC